MTSTMAIVRFGCNIFLKQTLWATGARLHYHAAVALSLVSLSNDDDSVNYLDT